MMKPTTSVLWLLLVLLPVAARAADVDAELLAREDARSAALTGGHWNELDALLAEDFFYNTIRGSSLDRQAFLAYLRTGAMTLSRETREAVRVDVYGDVAVVSGLMHVDATVDGESQRSSSRFLHVWVHGDRGWLLAARQVTTLATR